MSLLKMISHFDLMHLKCRLIFYNHSNNIKEGSHGWLYITAHLNMSEIE